MGLPHQAVPFRIRAGSFLPAKFHIRLGQQLKVNGICDGLQLLSAEKFAVDPGLAAFISEGFQPGFYFRRG